MENSDRRIGNRTNLDIVDLPFVGCREADLALLEYTLADVSSSGVQITVRLREGAAIRSCGKNDVVRLLLFLRPDSGGNRLFDQGRIMWTREGASPDTAVCGLHLEASEEEGPAKGHPGIPRRLSLSLETSNMVFENMKADSAQDFLLDVLRESVVTKESLLKELESASVYAAKEADHGSVRILERVRAEYEKDIVLLRSYNETAEKVGPEEGGPSLTYEEVCSLLKGDSPWLDFDLRGLLPKESAALERIKALHRAILADHNTLVLLRTGYLAYVYQNQEDSC